MLIATLAGCGDFFEKKTTELESRAVIRDISRVLENPHVGNSLPPEYLEGPKRLPVEDGVKLFYFTKYQSVGDFNIKAQQEAEAAKQKALEARQKAQEAQQKVEQAQEQLKKTQKSAPGDETQKPAGNPEP